MKHVEISSKEFDEHNMCDMLYCTHCPVNCKQFIPRSKCEKKLKKYVKKNGLIIKIKPVKD